MEASGSPCGTFSNAQATTGGLLPPAKPPLVHFLLACARGNPHPAWEMSFQEDILPRADLRQQGSERDLSPVPKIPKQAPATWRAKRKASALLLTWSIQSEQGTCPGLF